MALVPWIERQPDFANYFNPSYLAVLIHGVAKGYNGVNGGMSFALAFPAVTMALHPDIRRTLPRSTATRFSKWLRDNPELRIPLLLSTQSLVPQVKEAVLTSLRSEWVSAENGRLIAAPKGPPIPRGDKTFVDDQRVGAFVGKWFAKAGGDREIYQQIGIRP
ncbi:three component ABC system middle component [Hoeflea sp.]|uniref:three component ABC system middle component n=1 Tax=Hoeflea sp. TaxID=1940281 RepID=UPI003BAF40BF